MTEIFGRILGSFLRNVLALPTVNILACLLANMHGHKLGQKKKVKLSNFLLSKIKPLFSLSSTKSMCFILIIMQNNYLSYTIFFYYIKFSVIFFLFSLIIFV